jgi:integrase
VDKKKRVHPLLPTEHAALLAASRRGSPRYHLLFLVALRTGLRLSECFGVQWADFDLDARTVTVERQFREGRLVDRTKKDKVRVVDLSREVCEEFRVHRARMQREALAAGRPLSLFVFTTKAGGPIRSKSSFERRAFHRWSASRVSPVGSPFRISARRSAPISSPPPATCSMPPNRRVTPR